MVRPAELGSHPIREFVVPPFVSRTRGTPLDLKLQRIGDNRVAQGYSAVIGRDLDVQKHLEFQPPQSAHYTRQQGEILKRGP